jgi:subtilisin family serine protease
MKLRTVITVAATAVLSVAVGGTAGAAGRQAPPPRDGSHDISVADPRTRFVPGELLVRFKDGVGDDQRLDALRANGAERKRKLRIPGLELVRLGRGRGVEATARALANRPEVAYAEPNWIYRTDLVPNDPRFNELWGLNQASDADIDAPEAWNTSTGSPNVTVAVVDTGVAYLHTDLAQNIWANTDETDGDGDDDDGNGFIDDVRGWDFHDGDNNPADLNGHGTHVAGTIGARGNDAFGIPGVNWTVKLMPVRVLGADGSGTNAGVTEGFDYAGDNGAKVANASLGCNGCFSQAMKDVIDAHPDTLYVVAAGNSAANNDTTPHYPCAYTSANLLCVAATDSSDALASFSNYGATSVDLAAPGVNILSTWIGGLTPLFSDGLETSFSNWTTGGTNNTWARTNEAAKTGSWSATDSPGALYLQDTNSWMSKATAVSFAGQANCAVAYDLRIDVGNDFDGDWLFIEGSTDGTTWQVVDQWYGNSGGQFFHVQSPMSLFDGSSNVFVRFRLFTDAVAPLQAQGAHIDNIELGCAGAGGGVSDYNTISGTSMATPHVAGVAGLLWAANSAATRSQVQNALLNGVDPKASLSGKVVTGGRLNAANSVALIVPPAVMCLGSPATITGTGAGETLVGTAGNDVIAGLGGDDTLIGADGDDKLCGGDGMDTGDWSSSSAGVVANLTAGQATGQGTDTLNTLEHLTGSVQNDSLTGDAGPNTLTGGGGNDTLTGQAGNDTLLGGDGVDILRPNMGDDILNGGNHTDTADWFQSASGIVASIPAGTATGEGADTLTGIENLTGSNQGDQLTGNALPNVLNGFGGDDTLIGGLGNDTLRGRAGTNGIDGQDGQDTSDYVQSPVGVTADLGAGSATGEGTDTLTSVEHLTGSNHPDTLTGNGGGNYLTGNNGNDTLNGADGADTLRGGLDDDAMNGGNHTDVADFQSSATGVQANLTTNTSTGQGNDTFTGVENLIGSNHVDTLTGSLGNNVLAGYGNNDTLNGEGGNDVLRGNLGNDNMDGGPGSDTGDYIQSGTGVVANLTTNTATGEGNDTLANLEHLAGSNHVDQLTGNSGINVLIGNGNNDVLNGEGGGDTLRGGLGNDAMNGGTGSDWGDFSTVSAAVNADLTTGTATGQGSDTFTDVENLLGGTNSDTLTGNSGVNRLEGRNGNDTLNGMAGNDNLIGGNGTDNLDGGDDTDTCDGETETNCEL